MSYRQRGGVTVSQQTLVKPTLLPPDPLPVVGKGTVEIAKGQLKKGKDETPVYVFLQLPFELGEKTSYTNKSKNTVHRTYSTQRIIAKNPESSYAFFPQEFQILSNWETIVLNDLLPPELYDTKVRRGKEVNGDLNWDGLVSINKGDLGNGKPIGVCLYNRGTNLYVSKKFNSQGFDVLSNALIQKREDIGPFLDVVNFNPFPEHAKVVVKGKEYQFGMGSLINKEGKYESDEFYKEVDSDPPLYYKELDLTGYVYCNWKPQCSKSKGTYFWLNKEDKTKTMWTQPSECPVVPERCTDEANTTPTTGGRRKTRKNKKSKRKTKSRR